MLLIVVALKGGPQRFTRLRAMVPGVTSQVLRDSLRELARDGIVVRQEFIAVPPHVEYTLTDLGASLCEPARAIRAWAERHGPAVVCPSPEEASSRQGRCARGDTRAEPGAAHRGRSGMRWGAPPRPGGPR